MWRDDIVLMDGAIGTSLWAKANDRGAVWRYNLEKPDIVAELCREYVSAGSQIVSANTFGANRFMVGKTDYTVDQVVSAGVRIAREALNGRAKTALDIGPLPVMMEPYGDLEEDEAEEIFDEQISAGVKEHPDLIVLETFLDADMMRVAAQAASKHGLPIFCMLTFTEAGKTIMGHSVEYFIDALDGLPVSAVGLNCSLGPDKAVGIISRFREYTSLPLIFKPNAGKPVVKDGVETTEFDIGTFIEDSLPALDCDVKYIGGCCGSSPEYIRAMRSRIFGKQEGQHE